MKCSNIIIIHFFQIFWKWDNQLSYHSIKIILLFKIFICTCKLIIQILFIFYKIILDQWNKNAISLFLEHVFSMKFGSFLHTNKHKDWMVGKITIMQELFLIQALLSKLLLLTAMKSSSLYSMFKFIETSPRVKMWLLQK